MSENLQNDTVVADRTSLFGFIQADNGLICKSKDRSYTISSENGLPKTCTCDDYIHTRRKKNEVCKHIVAAREHLNEENVSIARETTLKNPKLMDYLSIYKRLKIPFPLDKVQFKPKIVGKTNGKADPSKKALTTFHCDVRAYQDRLNRECPGLWQSQARTVVLERKVIVTVWITIAGVTHSNVGEGSASDQNGATIAFSQAFKRACSLHGLGRYFYELQKIYVIQNVVNGKVRLDRNVAISILLSKYEWADPQKYLAIKNK